MAMKSDSTLSKSPEQEPHYQLQFHARPRISLLDGADLPLQIVRYSQCILSPLSSLNLAEKIVVLNFWMRV